jgi:hypothetical protein
VVIAQAARQVQLVGHRIGQVAEPRFLFDHRRLIEQKYVGRRGVEGHGIGDVLGEPPRGVEPAVIGARHPLPRTRVVRCEAELLAVLIGRIGLECIDRSRAGGPVVRARGRGDTKPAGAARGVFAVVLNHARLPVPVGGRRSDVEEVKVVIDVEGVDGDAVRIRLGNVERLIVSQRTRNAVVVARAVLFDQLPEDRRRDGQPVRRFPSHRDSPALQRLGVAALVVCNNGRCQHIAAGVAGIDRGRRRREIADHDAIDPAARRGVGSDDAQRQHVVDER